ncbi:DNA repair protein RecN [Micavibrio aeruginosavorus]|uniref:DNA repair protein RecN n=1 Tax=Micavibrio aeruginosavorus EPB TaxID=349215 RepID=M4VKI4_9BACT|nr:DNA repair protein RecN [Micavibrio aeruginosavorus]AGH98601.1 DNA repair protein RecN [Micavibrio aeruginosavorus EPB]
MLVTLTIRNIVLIDQLTVGFDHGFCALTGETGAGKSILLDSLGLALGARSDSGLVRKGQDQASVTAEFHIDSKHAVLTLLNEQGIAADDTLILRRVLGADGRSRAFINDQPVGVGLLKQVGDQLVEIHGQFDTHGLLDPTTHRDLLDDYAGLHHDVRVLKSLWDIWSDARAALKTAQIEAEKARAEEEYLRHSVAELDKLNPEEGEEDALLTIRETMKHKAHVLSALDEAWQAISSDDGAEMRIAAAARVVTRIGDKAPASIDPVLAALDNAASALQDAVRDIESMTSSLSDGDMSLEAAEDRLYALRGAARKFGCRPDDLPRLHAEMAEKLRLADRTDDILADLMKAVDAARAKYKTAAQKISDARAKAAKKMDTLVAAELPPLKLDKARFFTRVDAVDDEQLWGPTGMDRVQFLVATNPGADPGPLNKIASGGEMARFMLALKVVMADTGAAHTLIFDEVDTGIGGSTADAVGERLARLSGQKQILVVTHSPQVAARANHHLIVMKSGGADLTTKIIPLDELAERREEIARMLSGATITTEARAAADKLLEAKAG